MKDIPISSDRIQYRQHQHELVQLLRTGGAIQAHCMACDERWEMSTEGRADIARALDR